MDTVIPPSYSFKQISAILRGLLTIAWADGHYDRQEKEFIEELTRELAATNAQPIDLQTISAQELAENLGKDAKIGENFLRTAVLVAIADGVYSAPEAEIVRQFNDALGLNIKALESLEQTLYHPDINQRQTQEHHPDLLEPVKHWLDDLEIHDPRLAKFICKMVPSQCPFERDIVLFSHKIVHIPPLCKLNPLYEQLVGLRFRSLSYLADDCKQDISEYI